MNDYFEGFFGIKLTSNSRPEDILERINSFVMMKGLSQLNGILDQPVSIEVKTAVLVNTLNQARFLIIFDNFEDCMNEDKNDIESSELKKFIQHLLNNTISSTKFIITTRYDFDPLEGRLTGNIEHIPLPELQFPQTYWLMDNYTELANLDIHTKMKIYNVIGGHPWAIGQFAKHAIVQGVDDLLLDLSSLKKELIEFTLLDKSFSKLDENAKKLLLCASIYEEAVPVEALSWIIGDEKDAGPSIGESLQKLVQWGLISKEQEYDKSVYSEHTIVKDFALKKLKEDGLDKKELLIRAAKYYENLVAQNRNLWDHLRARDYYFQAENWESANEIVGKTIEVLIRWGYIGLAMDLLNESIRTTSGSAKTDAEYVLAKIYHILGDLNTALKIYNNVRAKYEESGNNLGITVVLQAIGMILEDQGNCEEALEKYNQALKIAEKLGDKSRIAYSLHLIGNIRYLQGNYKDALEKYNQSLKIKKELGDKRGIANSLGQLGNIHREQSNYKEALEKYNQSLKIEEELVDKSGIAKTLHQLGMIHHHQGNYEEAVKKYNQALKIKEELGDKSGIAKTLHQLGMIHQDQGNYKEALEKYNQSLKTKEELWDKRGIALTLHQIGNVHYLQGKYEEALEKYNQSLKIKKELGDKRGIASTLRQMGKIYEEKGEYTLALQAYFTTFSILKSLNSPYAQLAAKDLAKLRNKMGEEEFNAEFERLVNE